MEKNAKGKLVFTPLMTNADKQLSLLNLSNQPELSLDGSCSRKFFEANKVAENCVQGTLHQGSPFFAVLDMAGFTPPWTIPQWGTCNAQSFLRQHGPVLPSGHSSISLKEQHANVFTDFMATDLMACAKQVGLQLLDGIETPTT